MRGGGGSYPLHIILLAEVPYSPSHILLPTCCQPTIFSEYSRNILTEKLFHTLVEQKSELSRVKSGLRMRFFATFPHETSLAMRNQQSTQLISCLDIVNAKWNRKTARICSAESSKRLEYEDIPDLEYRKDVKHPLYSAEYSGIRSCQTPPIFRKKFRNNV